MGAWVQGDGGARLGRSRDGRGSLTYRLLFLLHARGHLRHGPVDRGILGQVGQVLAAEDGKRLRRVQRPGPERQFAHVSRRRLQLLWRLLLLRQRGGKAARALRAESRTPPRALMEGPGLPRRGGARSEAGPSGAGWRSQARVPVSLLAAPGLLSTPRPTWRTLNLDWPPLSANPSASAIPTLHRAKARARRC